MKRSKILKELKRLDELTDKTISWNSPTASSQSGYKTALRDVLMFITEGDVRSFDKVTDSGNVRPE